MTRDARRRSVLAAGAVIAALGYRGLALAQEEEGGETGAPHQGPSAPPAPDAMGPEGALDAPPTPVLPQAIFVLPDGPLAVNLEVARTDAERTKGLGGHAPLGETDGMLFVFDLAARHAFWMKGMTFPLDILWIDDGKVVHLERDLPPSGPQETDANRPVYAPFAAARYVLEMNAGFAARHGIGLETAVLLDGV
jgi:uncharacterized membrane protein (UPF0127 family)